MPIAVQRDISYHNTVQLAVMSLQRADWSTAAALYTVWLSAFCTHNVILAAHDCQNK